MSVSRENTRDAGLALILILLIAALKLDNSLLTAAAAIVALLDMIMPQVLTPFAWFWFGLSHLLSPVMSRVVLSLIYIFVVVPVGGIRRISGSDTMNLKNWKQGRGSVFVDRDHTFNREDLEQPY